MHCGTVANPLWWIELQEYSRSSLYSRLKTRESAVTVLAMLSPRVTTGVLSNQLALTTEPVDPGSNKKDINPRVLFGARDTILNLNR